uniref:ABC transporter ATP-binding protein n=1 Tax=uncultured Clostridium sp. TaxID=59620 RepID=UPI002634D6AB
MEIIRLKDISKTYGKNDAKTEALQNISFSINEGELVAIVGASGSGKSTILNILGCIDRATKGDYYFRGKKISLYSDKELAKIRNEEIGFVLQYFGLVPTYTVYENIELPL